MHGEGEHVESGIAKLREVARGDAVVTKDSGGVAVHWGQIEESYAKRRRTLRQGFESGASK